MKYSFLFIGAFFFASTVVLAQKMQTASNDSLIKNQKLDKVILHELKLSDTSGSDAGKSEPDHGRREALPVLAPSGKPE